MSAPSPHWPQIPLAPTLSPLMGPDETSPRLALERLSAAGFRHVQLSATHAGLRPRDLDASARRDLLAMLRRAELTAVGLDAWIPIEHFADASLVDRAVNAAIAAVQLAGDLGRLTVSIILPEPNELVRAIVDASLHHGIMLADHAVPIKPREAVGLGIDPAAWIAAGSDPSQAIQSHSRNLASVRLCDLARDGSRTPIGRPGGRLNIASYRLAAELAGYRQPMVIDARQWANPWKGIVESRDAWDAASPIEAHRPTLR